MKRKTVYRLVFAAATAAIFATSIPLRALAADEKIEVLTEGQAINVQGGALGASAADEKIASSFKQTYVYRTYLMDDAVSADVQNGVVTLTGTVSDQFNRLLAQETAASMPGVFRVDNQLVTKAEVDAENADTWIGRKVKLSLMFHRNVTASDTSVEVKDKVVTLKGNASSVAQKELTSEYAKDIEGVSYVNNEMTVVTAPGKAERTAGEQLDDASITAQVKMALLTHASTSSVRTKVETLNGEVILTGIAKNAAEKSLVTKIITDIQGVTSVKNQMTVKAI